MAPISWVVLAIAGLLTFRYATIFAIQYSLDCAWKRGVALNEIRYIHIAIAVFDVCRDFGYRCGSIHYVSIVS